MENLEKSEGLNQDIAKKLIEAGYSEQVEKMVRKNPEFFQ
jgi:hypothetical protein